MTLFSQSFSRTSFPVGHQQIHSSAFQTPSSGMHPLESLFTLLMNAAEVSNTTSASNETICDPSLLNNGTEKVEWGLCPETVVSQSISGIFLGIYVIFIALTFGAIIMTRNVPVIKFRSLGTILAAMSITCLFAVIFALRLAIGRKVFPCFIYVLIYYYAAPVVFLPTLGRMWRMIWMSRLNKQRVELFNLEGMMLQKTGGNDQLRQSFYTGRKKPVSTNELNTSSNNMDNGTTVSSTPPENPLDLDGVESVSDEYEDYEDGDDSDTTSVFETDEESSPLPPGSVGEGVVASSPLSGTSSTGSFIFEQGNKRPPTMSSNRTGKIELHKSALAKSTILTQEDINKYIAWEQKIAKTQLLTRWWWFLVWIAIFAVFHLIVWLITGLVETFALSEAASSTKFTITSDFFKFSHGCGVGFGTLIVVAVEGFMYIILLVVLLVFTIREDNDTWQLRWETLGVVLSWVFWIVAYVVAAYIPIIYTLTDAYFPYGYTLFFGVVSDNIITGAIPAIRALMYKKPTEETIGEKGLLVKVLRDKKMFEILLKFAKQSYCPEAPMCWKEIQAYKRKANVKKRRKMARNIYKKYLKADSPMELNLPSKFDLSEIEQAIEDQKKPLSKNFFDRLGNHCEQDIMDIFDRLRKKDKKIQEFIANIISKQNGNTETLEMQSAPAAAIGTTTAD